MFFKKKPNLSEIHETIANTPLVMLLGIDLNRELIIRGNCFKLSDEDAEFAGYAVTSVLYILGFLCMSSITNSIKHDAARDEVRKTLVNTLFTQGIAERLGFKNINLLAGLTSVISDKIKEVPESLVGGLERYSIAGCAFLNESLPFQLQGSQETFIKKTTDEFIRQTCGQFQADVLNINR